jgi:hypothetical protein
MKPPGDFLRALRNTVQKDLVQIIRPPAPAFIWETESDGRAKVAFVLPENSYGVQWMFKGNLFGFLKSNENADGALLVHRDDGSFDAHVVECKVTVNLDSWAKAKRQLRWTVTRLQAVAGALGIQIQRVFCYTAYRSDDEMQPDSAPDPTQAKLSLGDELPSAEVNREIDDTAQRQFDWPDSTIRLRDFDGLFPHERIELTVEEHEILEGKPPKPQRVPIGVATVDLRS